MARALHSQRHGAGRATSTLRITTNENESTITILLEGRIAGPWAVELSRTWSSTAPHVASRTVVLDLRSVTYADAAGKQVLRDISSQSRVQFVTSTPWSQDLQSQIVAAAANQNDSEANNAVSA